MATKRTPGKPQKRSQNPSERPLHEQRSASSRPDMQLEHALLAAVMESAGAQLAYLDRGFNFVMVNSAYVRGCGHSAEELLGGNHFQFFPNEENRAIFERVRGSGEAETFVARPFVFPDQPWRGTTYWDWTLMPVKDASGVTQGLVLSLVDVTESERAQHALRWERDKQTTILDSMEDGVLIVDEDYRVRYANPALRARFGEVGGRTCYQYLWKAEETCPWCNTGMSSSIEVPSRYECTFPELGASYDVVDTPLHNADGSLSTLKIFRDVTQRKRMEREIVDLERLAVLGRLSSGISHELRNPLATIDSSAYFLRSRLKDADAKVQTHLDRIRSSVSRCTEIIQSLVDLVKMKEPNLVEIDLEALVSHALAAAKVPETVRVNTHFADSMVVAGDWALLEMAFSKLIDNAVEAMSGEGEMTVSLRRVPNGQAEMSLTDTGPGIPLEQVDRVFEPFFSTKATGLGFGLPIAKMVIEKHGGIIEARPSATRNATLVVRLPAQPQGNRLEEDSDGRPTQDPGGG